MAGESNLENILASGKKAVTIEVGPPKSSRAGVITRKGELLNGYGDAFNITDNQTAIVRMSSGAAGVLLMNMGMEPVSR